MQILTFNIEDGTYAVDSQWIRELTSVGPATVTSIPQAPNWILGVAVVRGDVIPVLDLALFVGARPLQLAESTPMLVCQIPAGTVGVVVSNLRGTSDINEGLAAVGEHLRTWERLLLGVTPEGVGVLNLERLLSNQGLLLAQDY